tara:strand:+ start:4448 stop:4984 length:537 start_codon:yes stop_codon:yes gene_type:complete
MNKWIGISLGTLLGVSHLGMIGMIANRPPRMPTLNLPVNEYTSYKAKVNMDGYEIEYRANDPKTVQRIREVKKKGGFLGLGNNRESIIEQVPVQPYKKGQGVPSAQADARSEECIKAIGSGEGTGRMVGASVGGAVATTGLASIPFVGWVLAGAATMIGMDAGSEIGGQMAEDLSKEC